MKQAKILELINKNEPFKEADKYTVKVQGGDTGIIWLDKTNKTKQCKVGDTIEYTLEYNDKMYKHYPKFNWRKINEAMYNNFSKQENIQAQVRLDTGRSILLQVAFKEASQAYLAGKITVDEVEALTNKYYNIINK